jgi:hypothetical protein
VKDFEIDFGFLSFSFKTTKREVYLFPDYMSTGLWDKETSANLDPESIGITDTGILAAIRNWHMVWEFLIANSGGDDDNNPQLTDSAIEQWQADGQHIADMINEKYDHIKCIYRGD